MKNTVIAGLWLALIIGMPAGVGSGSVRIGFGLFLVVFLASGVAPAIYVGLKAKGPAVNAAADRAGGDGPSQFSSRTLGG